MLRVKYFSGLLGDYNFNVAQRFSAKQYYTKQRHSNDQQKETSDFKKVLDKKEYASGVCVGRFSLACTVHVCNASLSFTSCVPVVRRGIWLHNDNSCKA